MIDTIDTFRDEYFFLSNFYLSPITAFYLPSEYMVAITMPTGEHAFHATKVIASSSPIEDRVAYVVRMSEVETPNEAKRLGRQISIDVDMWNQQSYSVMWQVQRLKYQQNHDLAEKLIDTGDATLIEGNTWGDRLWGQVNGVGQNLLGKILMGVRKELADERFNSS